MKYLKYFLFVVLVFLAVTYIINPLMGVYERTESCSETKVSIQCNYKIFDGLKVTNEDIEPLEVHKGQVLHVEYNAVVHTGELSFQAIMKNKLDDKINNTIVWNETFQNDKGDSKDIPIENDCLIRFQIRGLKTTGNYYVKWGLNSLGTI